MNHLLDLNEQLLQSIASADWETYARLCDPSLTAFEPEACGNLVEGLDFHRYYFELDPTSAGVHNTIVAPHVRMLGDDVAVVCYNRIVRALNRDGHPVSSCFEETRVWQRVEGDWKHIHFHRSIATT